MFKLCPCSAAACLTGGGVEEWLALGSGSVVVRLVGGGGEILAVWGVVFDCPTPTNCSTDIWKGEQREKVRDRERGGSSYKLGLR